MVLKFSYYQFGYFKLAIWSDEVLVILLRVNFGQDKIYDLKIAALNFVRNPNFSDWKMIR